MTLFVIRSSSHHGGLSADHDFSGPQKFHARPVPRIGGLGVFLALVAGALSVQWVPGAPASSTWLLLVSCLPTFLIGLAEDLTKNVSPRRRLIATAASAGIAIALLGATVARTDIPGIDTLVQWAPFGFVVAIFAVTGVANSINIIDGFNGLASMCALMIVLAITYVASQVGDDFVAAASLITAGAVLGFFLWNFPAGLIFLGDGGAYLLGFLLAELGLLLVARNPSVSPICPLLLCVYPIFETVFTMYRRKFVRGVATAAPDGIHLHTLIHRRLVRRMLGEAFDRRKVARNSMTSPYLWALCLMSVIPSVLWWDNTAVLSWFMLLFVVSYVLLYASIVKFKTPKWLVFGDSRS